MTERHCGRPTIPREVVAAIIEREYPRYDGTHIQYHNTFYASSKREITIDNMVEHIARATGRRQDSVARRIRQIRYGSPSQRNRRTGEQLAGDVEVGVVDWVLVGLGRVDLWHAELAPWNESLIAYEQGEITLAEYHAQSAAHEAAWRAENDPDDMTPADLDHTCEEAA